LQGEYLLIREEQQKRQDVLSTFHANSVAERSVRGVFENLFTLLDDYCAVRKTFFSESKGIPPRQPAFYSEVIDSSGTNDSKKSTDPQRFEENTTDTASFHMQQDSLNHSSDPPTASRGRAAKRSRKSVPSFHGSNHNSLLSRQTDASSAPASFMNVISTCERPSNKESIAANGAHSPKTNVPPDSSENLENAGENFRSIYSDISESVLSDPQVLIYFMTFDFFVRILPCSGLENFSRFGELHGRAFQYSW
jgi:hypothetical protein